MYVNGGSIIAIGIIFPILGTIAVTGRFVARVKHQSGFKTDDWLCLPALAIVIATGAVLIYGSGRKIIGYNMYSELPPPQLLEELEFVIDAMNPIGTGLIRLSFLFFYRRIFRGRAFNIISWVMIALVICWIISLTIVTFAQCRANLWAIWTSFPAMAEYCIDTIAFLGLIGITSFLLDIVILTMPFFWIWRLQMPNSQKWAVTSVFLCGAFTLSAGATRMAAGISALTYQPNVPADILGLKGVNHVTGGTSIWLFWQYVEHGTGMVVCCMPTLKGLFTSSRSRVRRDSSPSRGSFKSLTWLHKQRQTSQGSSSFGSDEKEAHQTITVTNTVDQYTTHDNVSPV